MCQGPPGSSSSIAAQRDDVQSAGQPDLLGSMIVMLVNLSKDAMIAPGFQGRKVCWLGYRVKSVVMRLGSCRCHSQEAAQS